MTTLTSSAVRRDALDGTPTIRRAERLEKCLWLVQLEWVSGRRTDVIAIPKSEHTPFRVGTRVRVEILRSGSCEVHVLS